MSVHNVHMNRERTSVEGKQAQKRACDLDEQRNKMCTE